MTHAGVPLVIIWTIIHDAFKFELLAPKLAKAEMFERKWSSIWMDYSKTLTNGEGYVGYGLESGHEKAVFKIVNLVAKSASNANLIASNVLAKANKCPTQSSWNFCTIDHRNKTAIQNSRPKEGLLCHGGYDETNRS
jgi:hypothetical protein|uniref:Uncharacterized protein n=1 Tax=Attheya septentrionalis TaxID=420275 RepID=A0A7S2XLZ2_9STRA|mmetsp:Transcript_18080/g.32785  ORF Transcript_18080/g.32785 Transcript_18080/m.32785 type:complete len:137 (+) Transcript_18080:260-670(+)